MKQYKKLLKYALRHRSDIAWSVFFNFIVVFASLFSLLMLIPVLGIILGTTESVYQPTPFQGLGDLKTYFLGNVNYLVTKGVIEYGKEGILIRVLLFAGLMFLIKNIGRYLADVFLIRVQNSVENDLRQDIHRKVLQLPIGYFTEQRKGDIMARMTADLTEIQWALLSTIRRLVQDPLMIITTLIAMIVISPQLVLFVAILIPITGYIINRIGNTLKKPSSLAKKEIGRLMSYFEEDLGALSTLKSFNATEHAHRLFGKSSERYKAQMNLMMNRQAMASPVSELLGSFVIMAIMWFGAKLIIKDQSLDPAVFLTFISLFYQIINPAKNISSAIYDIKRGEASSDRIFQLLEAPNPLADAPDAVDKKSFDQSIAFDHVQFSYDGERPVLHDFSLDINQGETVALVGQSGSGKTTIANLINRFYDVDKGNILIDDIDLRQMKQADIHSLIGYITQESILFHESIESNIRMGNEAASMEEIEAAAKAANAHDFIMATEHGYQSMVGDRGQKLSGGQRQRISIARAFLKNPPILVLDEATSALDSESERLVQDALERMLEGRTAIVIAHRLSTIQRADQIIVMRNGSIVESGTHERLLSRKGEYQKMVELQALET